MRIQWGLYTYELPETEGQVIEVSWPLPGAGCCPVTVDNKGRIWWEGKEYPFYAAVHAAMSKRASRYSPAQRCSYD